MAFAKVADNLYITAQIDEQDFEDIEKLGIKKVICHRPDCEEAGQPLFESTRKELIERGVLTVIHQPVLGPHITAKDAYQLQSYLQEVSEPTLLYCRTGTRSLLLWSMLEVAKGRDIDELIHYTQFLGIDLSTARQKIESMMP